MRALALLLVLASCGGESAFPSQDDYPPERRWVDIWTRPDDALQFAISAGRYRPAELDLRALGDLRMPLGCRLRLRLDESWIESDGDMRMLIRDSAAHHGTVDFAFGFLFYRSAHCGGAEDLPPPWVEQ